MLFEDIRMARPTFMGIVPRICEMVYQHYQVELERRSPGAADLEALKRELLLQIRQSVLGGRLLSCNFGSAPLAPELREFMEACLGYSMDDHYGATEISGAIRNKRILRPPVIDYKLDDVPDLGYFKTDKPYPRGELVIKTSSVMLGYYKRPEVTAEVFDPDGYYRTGDIMAEIGPDQLVYLDRRNNVLKLSQGEFVTVSKLEAVFGDSPLVGQIYVYGSSARAYLLAVVVPTTDALSRSGGDIASLKPLIGDSLKNVAKAASLQSYEIPRDFIIETTPFTLENGLLTGIRKPARAKLKEHYGQRLERLYTELAEGQANELRALRHSGADRPALETISRAAGALLGAAATDLRPDAHFNDLGGDSLSALTFANL